MGNTDKSLCVALLARWSCTRLLRRLACLPTRTARGVWFPMFINPHGDTFPEDGTTAEELQNPMPEACVSYDGINYDTKSWAVLAFRNALWEILGGKRNVESRVGWEVPGRCETAACQRSGRPL